MHVEIPNQITSSIHPTFKINDLVKRKRGNWHGIVVGFYSTELTPEGYCVMSVLEAGAVHVESVNMLEPWDGKIPCPIMKAI